MRLVGPRALAPDGHANAQLAAAAGTYSSQHTRDEALPRVAPSGHHRRPCAETEMQSPPHHAPIHHSACLAPHRAPPLQVAAQRSPVLPRFCCPLSPPTSLPVGGSERQAQPRSFQGGGDGHPKRPPKAQPKTPRPSDRGLPELARQLPQRHGRCAAVQPKAQPPAAERRRAEPEPFASSRAVACKRPPRVECTPPLPIEQGTVMGADATLPQLRATSVIAHHLDPRGEPETPHAQRESAQRSREPRAHQSDPAPVLPRLAPPTPLTPLTLGHGERQTQDRSPRCNRGSHPKQPPKAKASVPQLRHGPLHLLALALLRRRNRHESVPDPSLHATAER